MNKIILASKPRTHDHTVGDERGILIRGKEKAKRLQLAALKQMLTLATNAFGLVAALAWNSVIQEFVNNYIKKWFAYGSGIISLLIYAILITILAVTITLQLSSITEKLEDKTK